MASNVIPAEFDGRPFDYTRPDSMNVIVLMTDGEHWPAEELNDEYRSGLSPIYRSRGNGSLSIAHDRSVCADYYQPDNNSWSCEPYSNTSAGYEQLT